MPLTLTAFEGRITAECSLMGDFSTTRGNLVRDGLINMCTDLLPVISASLSVTTGTTLYSVPATIETIAKIQDSARADIVYSYNQFDRKISLQSDPTTGTLSVYGTPREIVTNCAAVIAGLPENYDHVLWLYIRAAVYDSVDSDKADSMLVKAQQAAHRFLIKENLTPGMSGQTIQLKDVTGAILGDNNAADGINVDVFDFGETDSY